MLGEGDGLWPGEGSDGYGMSWFLGSNRMTGITWVTAVAQGLMKFMVSITLFGLFLFCFDEFLLLRIASPAFLFLS